MGKKDQTIAFSYTSANTDEKDVPYDTLQTSGGTFSDALMGGLSVRYGFANGFALFGSAAYTKNLPIIDDLGNSDFMTRSEKATTFEIGASYGASDVFRSGDALAIKGNLYKTTLRDVTSYTAFGSRTNTLERVETEDLEIEASYAMEQGFYLDMNANVVRGNEFQSGSTGLARRSGRCRAVHRRQKVRRRTGRKLGSGWQHAV